MEDPARDAAAARLFWSPALDQGVVSVAARPASPDDSDAVDFTRCPGELILLRPHRPPDQLLLRDGVRLLRLQVETGDLLAGAVRLRYELEGLRTLELKLLALRRLVALHRLGRFPSGLFPAERRAGRWIEILRTLDGIADGASQREIAAALFGGGAAPDWRAQSDYLRLRVQRLARVSRGLVNGGYLSLLKNGYRSRRISAPLRT